MKYPPIGLEVLGRCIFRNSYEDPYEKWLVVFYQEGVWRDTVEGEEQEVLFWREIDESPFVFDGLVENDWHALMVEIKNPVIAQEMQRLKDLYDKEQTETIRKAIVCLKDTFSNPTPKKKKQKHWDEESLRILQEMLNQGKKRGEIAAHFGVSERSIKSTQDRYKIKRKKDVESV